MAQGVALRCSEVTRMASLAKAMATAGRFGLALMLLASIASEPAWPAALSDYLDSIEPGALHPDADALGPPREEPPAVPLLKDGETIGWGYVNSDLTNSNGYSGKPIHVAVGLDLEGRITGAALLDHSEPIVLVGIPDSRVRDYIDSYVGTNALDYLSAEVRDALPADIVSGATVTIMVIDDSIKRSALRMVRAGDDVGGQGVAHLCGQIVERICPDVAVDVVAHPRVRDSDQNDGLAVIEQRGAGNSALEVQSDSDVDGLAGIAVAVGQVGVDVSPADGLPVLKQRYSRRFFLRRTEGVGVGVQRSGLDAVQIVG